MNLNSETQNKLYNYFISRLGLRKYRRGWLKGTCPYCGKDEKFGVHLSDNRTNCFRCGEHPLPIKVVADVEGLETYGKGWQHVMSLEELEYLEPSVKIIKQKPAKLPESYKLINLGTSTTAKLARKNLRSRGFSINKLAMNGVGYCAKGPYWGRIIIPFYQQGQLVYFNARQFLDVGTKFKNPTMEEFGIGKNLLIYNIDALALYSKIYMVESATNSLTLGDNSTAAGGKVLSEYQLSKYIDSPINKIVIILDPDAHHEALWAGLRLVEHKKVKVVLLPRAKNPDNNKDINDLGKKVVRELEKQTPWMSYQDIYRLYLKYPKLTIYNQ